MAHSDNPALAKVYAAKTDQDRSEAYDEWAERYDTDVTNFGIRLPYVAAAVFARHIDIGSGPILDAGCGTGMHTDPLALMGYGPFTGIDISNGMLENAKKRHIYSELRQMALGGKLDFEDNSFEHSYCIGTLAPGHAPPESLNDLIRVTCPGGLVIFSTHAHINEATQPFHDARHRLTQQSRWTHVFETPPFISMPGGDSAIKHAVYVYQVGG